ncbi:MAG: FtsQ-type POTRA domain-containing protein [Spirochaetia bacterium]|nr:FtsQ-type POTRA domain-containing protein [Spirochaetia bacterium]
MKVSIKLIMRRCILTKSKKILLSSIIILMAISSIFFALFNSQYLNINSIEVTIDQGEIPPSLKIILNNYNDKNIFRINCEKIQKQIENNPFIASAKVKITLSKKLRISLKKTQVDAIIRIIGKDEYAILSNKGLYRINNNDNSIIDNQLIQIEMDENVLNSLLKESNLSRFNKFIDNLDLLNDSSYLISSVKYDNNVNNSFGFFRLEFKNTNTIIRVREEVNTQLLKTAIELALNGATNNKKVLDVYHRAIIERNSSFGG